MGRGVEDSQVEQRELYGREKIFQSGCAVEPLIEDMGLATTRKDSIADAPFCPMTREHEKIAAFEVGRKIPGAGASSTFVDRFWHALPRTIFANAPRFGKFFRSLLQKPKEPKDAGSTPALWPMPLPFPGVCYRRGASAMSPDSVSLKKELNLQVAALNWLSLGKPTAAPREVSAFTPLTKEQWAVVHRLERYSAEWSNFKVIHPKDMGRAASKHEALEEALRSLETVAHGMGNLHRGYGEVKKFGGTATTAHDDCPDFDVVGKMSNNNLSSAQEIVADRIKMSGQPSFDPRPFLDPQSVALYEDPVSFSLKPWEIDEELPKVQVHATFSEKMKLLHKLDKSKRLSIARGHEIREYAVNGLFTVVKDLEQDRLIMDGRRPNKLQPPLNRWIQSMAGARSLTDITLDDPGDDLKDYYYKFQVDTLRSRRNCLAGPLKGSDAKQFSCCPPGIHDNEEVWACFSTLAMGDCSACEFAQTAHISLGLRSRAFTMKELLTLKGRVPRSDFIAGIIIDDMIYMEKVAMRAMATEVRMTDKALMRIAAMELQYTEVGLEAHPGKQFRNSSVASFWGAHVDGKTGLIRANPERIIPMMVIISRLAGLGFASVGLLEVVAGSLISAFSFRRRMFSLLHYIYQVPAGYDRKAIIRLPNELKDELMLCVVLAPLAVADARASFSPWIYMVDASDWGEAAVKTDVSKVLCKEMLRHSLTKPSWTKLLSPFKALMRSKGTLPEDEQLPEGVTPYEEHPVWEAAARCLQYRLVKKQQVGRSRHINVGELRSFVMAERDVGYKIGDVRVPISAASQVTLGATLKGRSSSKVLNFELQKSLPFVLGLGVFSFSGYTRSRYNPADDPTRGEPIRAPECEPPNWWAEAALGNFEPMDEYLESFGLSPEQMQGLPPVAELMPCGEVKDSSLHDKPKRLRRQEAFLEKVVRQTAAPTTATEQRSRTNLPWDAAVDDVLLSFPKSQFFLRDSTMWPPREAGFVDLYSGKKGFARAAIEAGAPWVLTFELADCASQDLSKESVREKIEILLRGGAVQSFSAAPVCASFSTAITPAVRTKEHPEGIPDLEVLRPKMVDKVKEGNNHNRWLSTMIDICCEKRIIFWIENPDGSFFWRQKPFLQVVRNWDLQSFRCDFCTFGTRWRKRTRFVTNGCLAGQKRFCRGCKSHQLLRGRSSYHKCSWTKVAEPYPRRLCSLLAWAVAYDLQLRPRRAHRRIGEAKNPGPARFNRSRDAGDLAGVHLVRPATLKLGAEQWRQFLVWLRERLGVQLANLSLQQAGFMALLLRRYGKELYADGKPLYFYRHLLIHGQREIPSLRLVLQPAWELVTKWELLEPVKHRPPLPVALLEAMLTLGLSWKWYRWCCATLLMFHGACRPGEVLRSSRRDLVLPEDVFLEREAACFLQIRNPKSFLRGLGKVQHCKITQREVLLLCSKFFGGLDADAKLYPGSAGTYRRRWDKLLQTLGIDPIHGFTPGSLRGGGAVHRYRNGASVSDVMWALRVKHLETLQHYLQEVTASVSLVSLPESARLKIQASASMFPHVILLLTGFSC
eukprot:Skav231511  [mRNA]  locus=scaffold84:334476:339113:- [translate_table: standard]